MIRDPKLALAVVAVLVVVLVALRDVLPPKWARPLATLAGALGATVHGLAAGAPLVDTLEHVAMLSIAGLAAGGLAPGPREMAPPTPRVPREPPPLPLLALFVLVVSLGNCTPAERQDAATAARAAVPACEAGLTLLADAPELAPLCAAAPEVEAAVAELIAEYQAADPGAAGAPVTPADKHRRVAARRARSPK